MNKNNKLLAAAVAKGLALTENGGEWPSNPQAGKTGETKSIFQFEPATWKQYSKEILGKDNVPMNADTESAVAIGKAKKWLDEGYSPPQIASMWNAGENEPDAYTGKFSDGSSSVGMNKKYGINFDVPGYAKKVDGYTKQIYSKLMSEQGQSGTMNGITRTVQSPGVQASQSSIGAQPLQGATTA